MKWYTDGPKTTTVVDAGIYVPSTKCVLSLGFCISVLQTKILAIEGCLRSDLF